jgi:hypothetical protein
VAIVLPIGDQKIEGGVVNSTKDLFGKMGQNCHISRKKKLNLPYLDNKVPAHWQNII